MNKEEILAKSRAENKNKDVYEQEVLKSDSKANNLLYALIMPKIQDSTKIFQLLNVLPDRFA